MARIEEKIALPRLHVSFAKREKTSKFSGLSTEDELGGMQYGK